MPGRLAYPDAEFPAAHTPVGMARLRVRVPARVGPDRALAVLGPEGRSAWLGEAVGAAGGDQERHLVDLELRVGEQTPRITFRKAAYVDVGLVQIVSHHSFEVAVSWRAAGLAPLFPVFSGHLAWADGELSLDGYYAPPGGGVGLVADRLLFNVAARGTARLLLKRIAAAMQAEGG